MPGFTITLPFWNEATFKIDTPNDAMQCLIDAAKPSTEREHFEFIVALWVPSIQESVLDANPGIAYAKLHALYLMARNHQAFNPKLLEAVVDQARALDFVLTFLNCHPEGQEQLAAEAARCEGSGFINALIMLAIAPDQFTREEIAMLFKRLVPAPVRVTRRTAA